VKVRPNAAPQPVTPLRANKAPGLGLTDNEDDDETIEDYTLDQGMENDPFSPMSQDWEDDDSLFDDEASGTDFDIDDIKFPEETNETPASDSSTPAVQPDTGQMSTTDTSPTPTFEPIPASDSPPVTKPTANPTSDSTSTKPSKPDSSLGGEVPLGNSDPTTFPTSPPPESKPHLQPLKLTIP
jgi:hypothetical protein